MNHSITVDTPIGEMTLTASTKGICALSFGFRSNQKIHNNSIEPDQKQWLEMGRKQLEEYFQGARKKFELPLDLNGPPFFTAVWNHMLKIPYAQTSSYKAMAKAAGSPHATRAAGQACARNPIAIIVPCHRVLASSGDLGGFSGGLEIKKWLLQKEQGGCEKRSPLKIQTSFKLLL
jgi:methylated-DNA-[protein]-cysteine S-methyltransferase